MAGSDPVSYDHNKMAVYCHDKTGVLQDVTQGRFVCGEQLTPVSGEMAPGSFYSSGNLMADIFHRCQSDFNRRLAAAGKIPTPSRGINVVPPSHAQKDSNLYEVMRQVTNQHKTIVNAWSIIEE